MTIMAEMHLQVQLRGYIFLARQWWFYPEERLATAGADLFISSTGSLIGSGWGVMGEPGKRLSGLIRHYMPVEGYAGAAWEPPSGPRPRLWKRQVMATWRNL